MPVTEKGFQKLSYEEIFESMENRAKLLFGDDIDTSDSSTFGKILRLFCQDAAESQELAEAVYLSAYPSTAFGVSLDRVCSFKGISRNPATYSVHVVKIHGENGTVIPVNFMVATDDGEIEFYTMQEYTIANGNVTANVVCTESGAVGNVSVGKIVKVVNPVAGVERVEHIGILETAKNTETDFELRSRFEKLNSSGMGTVDAIRNEILKIPNVDDVYIAENDTSSPRQDGINVNPYSFRCFVTSPVSQHEAMKTDIARAIFSTKPLGIVTSGDVSETVNDLGGVEHKISFSWTEQIDISVNLTIVINENQIDKKDDILTEIRDNIIRKINSLGNGETLALRSLYSGVFVEGVADLKELKAKTATGNYTETAIEVKLSQIIRTSNSRITIEVGNDE